MRLVGKTVIITGASAGLGKAAALAVCAEGANVVMAARRPEKLAEAAQEVRAAGGQVLAVPTDVGRSEQVQRLVDKTLEAFGRVDVLINNAAIDYPGPITELTVAQWDQIIPSTSAASSPCSIRAAWRRSGTPSAALGSIRRRWRTFWSIWPRRTHVLS